MASFGSKVARGRKCSCEKPNWRVWELQVTYSGELQITFECNNCKQIWNTKSRKMREKLDLDGKYNNRYIRDYISLADNKRRDILTNKIDSLNQQIEELQAERDKSQNELDIIN